MRPGAVGRCSADRAFRRRRGRPSGERGQAEACPPGGPAHGEPDRPVERGHLRRERGPVGQGHLTGEHRRRADLAGGRVVRGALGRAAGRLRAQVGEPAALGDPQRVEHHQAGGGQRLAERVHDHRHPGGRTVADDSGGIGVLPGHHLRQVPGRRTGVGTRCGQVATGGEDDAPAAYRDHHDAVGGVEAEQVGHRRHHVGGRADGETRWLGGVHDGSVGGRAPPRQPLWTTRGPSTDTERIGAGQRRSATSHGTRMSGVPATLRTWTWRTCGHTRSSCRPS